MNQLKVLFYETAQERADIEVFFEDETFWLSITKENGRVVWERR